MLRELTVRDMLLIERLELSFSPGLNVLTGETGAGKSILLDCLGFVLGWRGRAELVRAGATEGEVTAVFDLSAANGARAVLEEAGIEAGDEMILRRLNAADGRKRGYINDRRVSGEVLRALSASLVELHGQQDDRGLLDPRQHRALLDEFGGLQQERQAVRDAWAALSAARQAHAAEVASLEAAGKDADFLRHAVAELDALAPEPGEDATLDTARRRMQAADKIREDVARAAALLGPEGAETPLADALRWLEGVADRAEGTLEPILDAVNRAMIELGEAQAGVGAYLQSLDVDPLALERTEERLFAIRGLARKHDVLPDDLADLADTLRERLAQIDQGAGRLQALEAEAAAAEAAYGAAAKALTAARSTAAEALDARMAEELPPLKLDRALFATVIERAQPGPEGQDDVQFRVATNPGAAPGPIGKVASGGELSRFLLALKVCLSGRTDGLTMIFDEIDRGVGGATADAVGRRLAQVAAGAQVLVVTHSPQVAAQGAHHFQVSKHVNGEGARTEVRPLDAAARVDEIARMLSGDTISDAARSAAQALLEPAG